MDEVHGSHHAHGGEAGKEQDDAECVCGRKVAGSEEKVADDDVEESPKDVDEWGRETFAGRFCEGCWKGVATDALDEVRNGIREEHSGKETADVVENGHGGVQPFLRRQ